MLHYKPFEYTRVQREVFEYCKQAATGAAAVIEWVRAWMLERIGASMNLRQEGNSLKSVVGSTR